MGEGGRGRMLIEREKRGARTSSSNSLSYLSISIDEVKRGMWGLDG